MTDYGALTHIENDPSSHRQALDGPPEGAVFSGKRNIFLKRRR
jgi:hypothetical protein